MSEIINKFKVFNDLSEDFKHNIQLFYVFGDFDKANNKWTEKRNVLIVTKNDEVYAFGGNSSGILGLGQNNFVSKPTIVNELCDKNIVEFKNGWFHCMARTYCGKIYSFGMNFRGHLGIGEKDNEFHKPKLVSYLNDMKIIDMCCGGYHSLVLTNLGEVYVWGDNRYRQLGIENFENVQLVPIKVIGFNNERVLMISCGLAHSLALTECGHVFSWGYNDCGQLGYQINNNERKRPEIVSVKDNEMNKILINKISCGLKHNLLLANDGNIYTFGSNECGELGDDSQFNRTEPMKLNIDNKFIDIATLNHSWNSVAVSLEGVHYTWGTTDKNNLLPLKTEFRSIIDTFNLYKGYTYKTVEVFNNDFIPIKRYNKYFDEFEESKLISTGSFGIVCKAMDRNNKIFYAIKKIPIKKNEIRLIRRELLIMTKLKSNFIVEHKSTWIEKNYIDFKNFENNCDTNKDITSDHQIFHPNNTHLLHIQMELCLKTLNEVIAQLNLELNSKELINFQQINYYILSELLKEILESVDFLHKENIIHRDLKPENILVNNGIDGRFIKIADFGLSIIHDKPDQLHTQCLGTIKYMAPEVLRTRKYDTKADIYSLGVIIHELLDLKPETSTDAKPDNSIKQKTSKLREIKNQMLSYEKSLRPDCQQILNESSEWVLSLNDMKNDNEFKQIITNKNKMQSLEKCFHSFFIQQKCDFFFKCLTVIKQSIHDKYVKEMWQIWDQLLSKSEEDSSLDNN